MKQHETINGKTYTVTSPPVGIQRKRVAGYDMQAESMAINGRPAKSVCRPHKWGNIYYVKETAAGWGVCSTEDKELYGQGNKADMLGYCLFLFGDHARMRLSKDPAWLEPLRGYNLACFCGVGEPCHRDVYLELLYGFGEVGEL